MSLTIEWRDWFDEKHFSVIFNTVDLPEKSIVLPGRLYELVKSDQLELTYGLKEINVSITPSFEEQDLKGNSIVNVSNDVAESLFLYSNQ
uniref:hypothetical protein n=1 Tax=Bacillus sp. JCM 19041 TaxID=1460637 RepID=UPI000AF9C666